ncbi:hypothetical protein [Geotoga petraea]|uniref:Uncharacterized protein n=1 Tax=Geotoga petraea TaxID=28234 RepID=A0A1G6LP31_9BACT|nr:hypothetical protein [Geotoga petraea]SDC45032.1 hypothetical protein SAMN04488588_1101 [Geotoga petraea]
MSKCKLCNRKGLFFKTNKYGLCEPCTQTLVMTLERDKEIFDDSIELINISKNIDTKLSRIEVIEEIGERLLKYEKKKIKTVDPKPSKLLKSIPSLREDTIVRHYKKYFKSEIKKIKDYKTSKTRIKKFQEYYNQIEEHKNYLKKPKALDKYLSKINDLKDKEL